MRRLSVWQKERLRRIARDRMKRRRQINHRKRKATFILSDELDVGPPRQAVHSITIYRRGKVRRGVAHERTPMPENFCLIENYEVVSEFLMELRHKLTIAGQQLEKMRMEGGARRRRSWNRTVVSNYVDFASLTRITPVAALVLASEYDRVISVFKVDDWLRAINVDQWKSEVFATLQDVGFLALLGVDRPRANIAERNGIITVPFISGSKVQGASIDRLIRIMANLADSSGVQDSETLLKRSRVYDGLGEAIQNVEDHAYPAGFFGDYPVAKKWWMTGAVEPSKKRFTIAIYDHGISIPVSLPRWTRYEEFRASLAKAIGSEYNPTDHPDRDGETIAQAVQLGRSSTGKVWHGKGLAVIRDIIDNCEAGTVRILSRNGEYCCTAGQTPGHISHKSPMTGTLVEWEMLL